MNVNGEEDQRILKHAFLNSYFQTGLKNLIDIAIINRADKEKMNIFKEKYVREDEIPFDFSRRRMSVVLKDDEGKRQLITKGAVDEVMSCCSFIDLGDEVVELTDERRKKAYAVYEENNRGGLRVLAVAQKNNVHDIYTFGVTTGVITDEDVDAVPDLTDGSTDLNLRQNEKSLIKEALLKYTGPNGKLAAAQALGISKATLYRKIKEYGLE